MTQLDELDWTKIVAGQQLKAVNFFGADEWPKRLVYMNIKNIFTCSYEVKILGKKEIQIRW